MPLPAPRRRVPTILLLCGIALASAALVTVARGIGGGPEHPTFRDDRPLIARPGATPAEQLPGLRDPRPLAVETRPAPPAPGQSTAPFEAASAAPAPVAPAPAATDVLAAVHATAAASDGIASTSAPAASEAPAATAARPTEAEPAAQPSEPQPDEAAPAAPSGAAVAAPAADASVAPDSAVPVPAGPAPASSGNAQETATAVPPASEPSAADRPVPTARPPVAVDGLLKRARRQLGLGDIAGARRFLERGLAAGDAEAALLLGATYDPRWLRAQGAHGVAADIARSRTHYAKARELGSPTADARLRELETPER